VLLAILAPFIAPYDPLQQNLRAIFQTPSLDHLLGTDSLGRDVFTRLLYGARVSIPAAALATGFAMLIGIPIGMLMGYTGRRIDRFGMIATDVLMTFPGVILAIALVAVFGNNLLNAMLALGLVFSPSFVRLARAETLAARAENYVTAARLLGYPTRQILFRHLLPNVVPALVIQVFLTFSFALLAQSGLAFLGIGVQPPNPAWGSMLAQATTFMSTHPFLIIPPGVAIAITALSASLIGDGIRDSLGVGIGPTRVRSAPRPKSGLTPDAKNTAVVRDGSPTGVTDVLVVEDLTIGFHRGDEWVTIVDSVSLRVPPGSTLGLVGESGSGKSVTALAVLGLLPSPLVVRHGSIVVNGVDLLTLSERELRSVRGHIVSMVFQDPLSSLNPTLTIGQQLIETIKLYQPLKTKQARDEAVQLLQKVGISNAADRLHAYPHEFSGGMAQRVMIAMAIAGSPQLIVADEPTTALDVTVQIEILDLLRQLQHETGVGILFITHDMGVVADICDAAAVMFKGKIVETAQIDDLFANPRDSYTKELLDAIHPHERPAGLSLTKGAQP
jgi:peptide/nickel transport system permease protein